MYSKNDVYTFYMFFKANDSDAWWEVSSVTDDTCTTAGIKNFRVMFQMGDDDSDWQGLRYQFTTTDETNLT